MRKGLNNLVGLVREKEKARIAILACQKRGVVFPHTLLWGPGGCGKTAFARGVAEDLAYHFQEIEAAALSSRADIINMLTTGTNVAKSKRTYLLLFVDEIHALTLKQQEAFYYPIKEWHITTTSGIVRFPPFCLFGATTRMDET